MASDVPADPSVDRAAAHWSRMAEAGAAGDAPVVNWLESPLVQRRYVHPAVAGTPDLNWFAWVMTRHVPRDVVRACTLGCGSGGLERHARQLGCFAPFDAFDVSEASLRIARAEAARYGIEDLRYVQADLNERELPEESYDVVFASMALHHLFKLEETLDRVARALRPGGLLVFDEFVGPRRFQWTDLQLALTDALLAALPERLRLDLVEPGAVKSQVRRPSLEWLDVHDPSEAAFSDRILPEVEARFDRVALRPYGGTLLHLVLDRIVGNFREDDPDAVARFDRLAAAERALLDAEAIPSDFAVGVYRRRDGRRRG